MPRQCKCLITAILLSVFVAACGSGTPSPGEQAVPANETAATVAPPSPTLAPQPTEGFTMPKPAPTDTPTRPVSESLSAEKPSGYSVNVYEGDGFSIFYPPGAEIASTKVGVAVVGPDVAVRPADADWVYEGPAYVLTVETFANPDGQDVDTWTRNFLLQLWQQAKEGGFTPPEIYPVTEDGRIVEEALRTALVRGRPAVLVENYAFGILDLAFYVECPGQVARLEFQFRDEPATGTHPLIAIQQDMYALLKDGFWCYESGASAEAPPPLPAEPTTAGDRQDETSYVLRVYRGEEAPFRLAYPPNAQVVPSKTGLGVTVLGPDVAVRPGDADWSYSGPVYALDIATFEMSSDARQGGVEAWTRAYLLRLWEEEKQQGGPTGSLPVLEDGTVDESRVGATRLNGEPAFWVQYSQFDAMYQAFYVQCADHVVNLGFREEIPANQPLADVQRNLYSLLLNTFECASSVGAEG